MTIGTSKKKNKTTAGFELPLPQYLVHQPTHLSYLDLVSSPDHALRYVKVGLVTLVDFLGIDLFFLQEFMQSQSDCRTDNYYVT